MAYTVVLHIPNDDPVVGEIDALPSPADTLVTIKNPRRRDGKDLHFLQSDVVTVIWPLSQVAFLEVLPSDSEEAIVSFVRE
ncbi:MAG: hypothetical protein FJZ96_12680 [Chloroflexi bacterium]|nr:hypothetical protein [Chloroflexota bacterium]